MDLGHEPAVRTVRASVRPGNTASRNPVLAAGFRQVGEQDDREDGLEIVYEVSLPDRDHVEG